MTLEPGGGEHPNDSAPSTKLPRFPQEILEGPVRDFVNLYTPIRESPEQFLWLSFVTFLGNAICPYVRLMVDGSEARIYGAILRPAAWTDRLNAFDLAKRLFRRALTGRQQLVVEGFQSIEALLNDLRQYPAVPTVVHVEDLLDLVHQKTLARSVGIGALNRLFEENEFSYAFARGRLCIVNAWLSILGNVAFDELAAASGSNHRSETGFLSRLLMVAAEPPEKPVALPRTPDESALRSLADQLAAMIDRLHSASLQARDPLRIGFTAAAESRWERLYSSFHDKPEWSFLDTYGFRLLTIQAVIEDKREITPALLDKVEALLQYQVALRTLIGINRVESRATAIEGLILRHMPPAGKVIRKRDLERKANANRCGIERFQQAVESLKKRHKLVQRRIRTPAGKLISVYERPS